MNTVRQRTTTAFFGKKFSELIEEWKKLTNGTQEEFAKKAFSNKNSIGNYKRGQIPNDDKIQSLIDVFNDAGMNVSIEDFVPHGDDTFKYDPSRVKAIQEYQQKLAEEIGLSDGFLDFIFNHTDFSDPDEGYPIWSPLSLMPFKHDPRKPEPFKTDVEELKFLNGISYVQEFGRLELLKTHVIPESQKMAVKMQDGTTVILTEMDLRVLKDLQDKIVDMVKYLYFVRRKEMRTQVINATKQRYSKIQPNQPGAWGILGIRLSKDDLIAIDPYMQYLEWIDETEEEG